VCAVHAIMLTKTDLFHSTNLYVSDGWLYSYLTYKELRNYCIFTCSYIQNNKKFKQQGQNNKLKSNIYVYL